MFDDLLSTARRPEPYEPGAELWNDPHISKGMLDAHLATDTDAASYHPEAIVTICEYLASEMNLKPGDPVADLGCGPGLYCVRLSAMGLNMTGIDRSERSIRYARAHAGEQAEFVLGSYLDPFGEGRFRAALMISQDYGVLSPENRRKLLANVHRALRPGGWFALDVPSLAAYLRRMEAVSARWQVSEGGFWRPHRHLLMEDALFYPEIRALCDRYIVADESGVVVYRVWQTFFSPESIRAELEEGGFAVKAILSGLDGEPFREDSPVLGILCKRK